MDNSCASPLERGLHAIDTLGRDPRYLNQGILLNEARIALARCISEGLGRDPVYRKEPLTEGEIKDALNAAWLAVNKEITVLWMAERTEGSIRPDILLRYSMVRAKDAVKAILDEIYPEEGAYFDG